MLQTYMYQNIMENKLITEIFQGADVYRAGNGDSATCTSWRAQIWYYSKKHIGRACHWRKSDYKPLESCTTYYTIDFVICEEIEKYANYLVIVAYLTAHEVFQIVSCLKLGHLFFTFIGFLREDERPKVILVYTDSSVKHAVNFIHAYFIGKWLVSSSVQFKPSNCH